MIKKQAHRKLLVRIKAFFAAFLLCECCPGVFVNLAEHSLWVASFESSNISSNHFHRRRGGGDQHIDADGEIKV